MRLKKESKFIIKKNYYTETKKISWNMRKISENFSHFLTWWFMKAEISIPFLGWKAYFQSLYFIETHLFFPSDKTTMYLCGCKGQYESRRKGGIGGIW